MEQIASDKGLSTQDLMSFFDELTTALRYMTLTKPLLAIDTDKTKVKITNTTNYVHDGIMLQKTTAAIAFTATTHDITADADSVQERCYLYSIDAAGTVTVTAGDQATGAGNAVVPATPAGKTPLGYVRLAVAAGSTDFDATTDELDEAHITDTYVDFGFRFGKFSAAYENGSVTAE